MNPSNLSLFCFYEKIQDGSDKTNRLLLHVMAKDGRTRSKDEIQKSLKQVVVTRTNYTEMKEQLLIFVFVTGILFGTKSFLPLSLRDLHTTMLKYSSELKHKIHTDNLLPTKILFAVDQELQRWLKDCKSSKHREEVEDEILEDLSRIISDVVKGRFYMDLPKSFKMEEDKEEEKSGPIPKKPKIDNGEVGNRLENPDQNPDYKLLDGESFKRVFCGRNYFHRVPWDKNKKIHMCPRWHSKYYCFDNCRNIESHVPQSQVSTKMDTDYKKYLKKIRKT